MAKKNEVTVEEKLRALYDLQLIDSRVDEIRNVRGELPLEVEDLEDEIAGLEKRLENFNQEVSDFDLQSKEQKNNIEQAKEEFKKYEEKLKNVRNNREYNSIVKEQEYQELEIQLSEKRIKEFSAKKELIEEAIGQLSEKLKERKNHLKAKKADCANHLIGRSCATLLFLKLAVVIKNFWDIAVAHTCIERSLQVC